MADETPKSAARPRPRRRRKGRLLWILALVVFLLSFGVTLRFSAVPSKRLAALVQAELDKLVNLPVSVGEARIDASTFAVVVSNVKLGRDPQSPDVEIPRARIELRMRGAEAPEVRRVFLDGPVVRFSAFSQPLFKATGTPQAGAIPTIVVNNGTIEVPVPAVGKLRFSELTAVARAIGLDELQLSGTVRTPLHGVVRFGGGGSQRTGRLDVRAETETPVDLSSPAGAEFDPEIAKWRKALEPAGRLSLDAHLTRESADAPLLVETQLEGSGLSFSAPALEIGGRKIDLQRVNPTDFKLSARLDADGSARLSAEGRILGSAALQVLAEVNFSIQTGTYSDLRLGARVRQLILGPNIEQLLDNIDPERGIGDVYRGLHPEGPVDVTLGLTKAGDGAPLGIACDVDLTHDLSLAFLGFPNRDGSIDASFPYKITDPSGRVSIRPGRVYLTGVRARVGSATAVCHGEISGGGLVGLDVAVRLDDLFLDGDIEKAIRGVPTDAALHARLVKDPAWKPIGLRDGATAIDLFDLEGKVRVDIRAKRPQGLTAADVAVRLSSDGNLRGTFRQVPIPVDALLGSVTFRGGDATFAFDGAARGGKVRVEGGVDGAPRAGEADPPAVEGLRLRIRGSEIDVSDNFGECFRASAPELSDLFVELEPSVRADFEFRGERPRNSAHLDMESTVSLRVNGGVVRRVPDLGVELEDVKGSILVTMRPAAGGKTVYAAQLASIRAKYFGEPVLARGTAGRSESGKRSLDLEGIGLDLPFTGKLIQQIVSRESPEAAAALARFTFGGKLEARFHRVETEELDSERVEFELRDAAISGPGLPGNFEGYSGHFTLAPGNVLRSDSLTGRLDGVEMRIDNFEIVPGAATDPVVIRGTSTTDEAVDMIQAMTAARPAAKPWVKDLDLSVSAIASPVSWEVNIDNAGDIRFDAVGHLLVKDGRALRGGTITSMQGDVDLELLHFDKSGFTISSWAEEGQFEVRGIPFTNFSGHLELDANELELRSAQADVAGGRVGPRPPVKTLFKIRYGDPDAPGSPPLDSPRWHFSGLLQGAELGRILEHFAAGRGDVQGAVRTGLDVKGVGLDIGSFEGSGVVRIEDANLFEVPGFQAVYNGLELEKKPVFHEMVGEFTVFRGRVDFRTLSLKSDPLDLKGNGWVSLDGRLDMTFLPRVKEGISAFLNPAGILNFFQDRIIDVSVFGTIDNTRYTVNLPFSTKSKLKKQVIAPEPPADLGTRF
jgi:hypothetical protein